MSDAPDFRNADRPESIEALRACVARRVGEGLAIYPRGGGTALDYGGGPSRPGVVLDTTALARVVDYPAGDMTITVEAGVSLASLQRTLAQHGQRLPLDAPQPDRATLGGIFATNFSGPRRFGWGRPRDLIIGIGFVTADGQLVRGGGRVVKNVAGYDFPRLLTGSMGTLGVIAELTLKVRPAPESNALAWVGLPDAEAADRALERLNVSATRPVALELLNRPAADRIGGPLGLPAAAWTLAVGFEDNAESVAWQADQIRGELAGHPLEVRRDADAAPLWSALSEFADRGDGPISLVANLRPSGVVPFASRLDPARWAVQAHAGSGIVRAHALPGADPTAGEIATLRAEADRHGGGGVLARCPADRKAELGVWGSPRGDWDLMRRVRAALDPAGLMNPGRSDVTMG